jgi:hypothetical protein
VYYQEADGGWRVGCVVQWTSLSGFLRFFAFSGLDHIDRKEAEWRPELVV